MNYLPQLFECLRPDTDEHELDAFKYNDSKEIDEHPDIDINYWGKRLQIEKKLLPLESDRTD